MEYWWSEGVRFCSLWRPQISDTVLVHWLALPWNRGLLASIIRAVFGRAYNAVDLIRGVSYIYGLPLRLFWINFHITSVEELPEDTSVSSANLPLISSKYPPTWEIPFDCVDRSLSPFVQLWRTLGLRLTCSLTEDRSSFHKYHLRLFETNELHW